MAPQQLSKFMPSGILLLRGHSRPATAPILPMPSAPMHGKPGHWVPQVGSLGWILYTPPPPPPLKSFFYLKKPAQKISSALLINNHPLDLGREAQQLLCLNRASFDTCALPRVSMGYCLLGLTLPSWSSQGGGGNDECARSSLHAIFNEIAVAVLCSSFLPPLLHPCLLCNLTAFISYSHYYPWLHVI